MSRRELALKSPAWPFEEARKLLPRVDRAVKEKGYVLFETGYGPSGLPHIGTFGEVARTTWVRRAFATMSDAPTKLIAFSDDMDGLRKVPGNVPNQDMLREYLGKPLTVVPDPFGKFESYGAHNNAMLRAFLDQFGFEYEFMSSTDCYKSGRFDAALMRVLELYDEVSGVILPTLGPERRATYSPFLPVSPKTGRVLQVPVLERDTKRGTVVFEDEDGTRTEVPVTGGHCKLQWKADWAMRWYALGVDYEMAGKDLISSVELSSKVCKVLGREPPAGFNYELFLDENSERISKSKGNGISIEEWLRYASPESLSLYMYQKPKTAKRLFFDVIPKAVDEYAQYLEGFENETPEKQLLNPIAHIHGHNVPTDRFPVTFGLLLTLVSASNAHDRDVLWGFIRSYAPGTSPKTHPALDKLVGYAQRYYEDFVKPTKRFRAPTDKERAALEDLAAKFDALDGVTDSETVQNEVYEVGKAHKFEPLRDWFKALYEVLFGQEQGPRFGSFAALYGTKRTAALIREALSGAFVES